MKLREKKEIQRIKHIENNISTQTDIYRGEEGLSL